MAKESGVSLRPRDAVESSGLVSDVDLDIVKARFGTIEYKKKDALVADNTAIGLILELKDEEGQSYTENYSAGKGFVASADGLRLLAETPGKQLQKNSNFMQLMEAAVNAGLDEDEIEDDISFLDGKNAHFVRQPQKQREGLANQGGKVRTILLPTKFNEKKAGKKGAAAGAKASKKGDAPVAGDLASRASEYILEALADNDGTFESLKALSKAIFPKMIKAKVDVADRKLMSEMIASEEFHLEHAEAGGWAYDDGVVMLAD